MHVSYFHSKDNIWCTLLCLEMSGDVIILDDVQRSNVGDINKMMAPNMQDLGDSLDKIASRYGNSTIRCH